MRENKYKNLFVEVLVWSYVWQELKLLRSRTFSKWTRNECINSTILHLEEATAMKIITCWMKHSIRSHIKLSMKQEINHAKNSQATAGNNVLHQVKPSIYRWFYSFTIYLLVLYISSLGKTDDNLPDLGE